MVLVDRSVPCPCNTRGRENEESADLGVDHAPADYRRVRLVHCEWRTRSAVQSEPVSRIAARLDLEPATWRAIVRQSSTISVSLIPFGLAFGVACVHAQLTWGQAVAFSTLVFTGGSQFAAVGVLGDGGAPSTAIAAGLLVAIRSFVYGLVMTPVLRGSLPFRILASHLTIDESVAISTAQPTDDIRAQRVGFLVGGLAVFALWNLSTVVGAIAFSNASSFIKTWGIDATIPAAFLALVWPRLGPPDQRRVAFGGAVIALCAIPLVPAGVPIVLSAFAVVGGLRRSAPGS